MARTIGPKTDQNGLLAFYDFGNVNSYPGLGDTVYDLSINGNHGSLYGASSVSTDGKGSLVLYRTNVPYGTNDPYLQVPFESELTNCTFIIWFKGTAPLTNRQYLFSISNGTNRISGSYFALNEGSSDSQTLWAFWGGSAGNNTKIPRVGSQSDYLDSTWRCLAFTRDVNNSPYTFNYMNGKLVNTTTRTGTQTSTFGAGAGYYLTLGNQNISGEDVKTFIGNIAMFKVYNRAFSAHEIESDYVQFLGRFK